MFLFLLFLVFPFFYFFYCCFFVFVLFFFLVFVLLFCMLACLLFHFCLSVFLGRLFVYFLFMRFLCLCVVNFFASTSIFCMYPNCRTYNTFHLLTKTKHTILRCRINAFILWISVKLLFKNNFLVRLLCLVPVSTVFIIPFVQTKNTNVFTRQKAFILHLNSFLRLQKGWVCPRFRQAF